MRASPCAGVLQPSLTRAIADEACLVDPEARKDHFAACELAMVLLARGGWEEALDEARKAVSNEDLVRGLSRMFTSLFSHLAALGHAAEALAVLRSSPAQRSLEPLLVALQIIAGEDPNAPQEVVEVANDIVRNVEELRQDALIARPKEKSKRTAAPKRSKAASPASRRGR